MRENSSKAFIRERRLYFDNGSPFINYRAQRTGVVYFATVVVEENN